MAAASYPGEYRRHPLKLGCGQPAKFGRLYYNPLGVLECMVRRYFNKLRKRCHTGKFLGVVEGCLHVGVNRCEYIGTIRGRNGNRCNSLVRPWDDNNFSRIDGVPWREHGNGGWEIFRSA